jgi:CRISPR-associated endonuclease/helicase Cas3
MNDGLMGSFTKTNTNREFYAHTLENDPNPEHWQRLEDHLLQTAKLAGAFAEVFGAKEWGFLAGLWHDLGKYSKEFQDMLLQANNLDAHIEKSGKVDHSSAGAQWAFKFLKDPGKIISYLITGHHGGLLDGISEGDLASLKTRLEKQIPSYIAPDHILNSSTELNFPFTADLGRFEIQVSLFIRMLYSSLVDADFLDTEAFLDKFKASWRKGYPSLEEIKHSLDCFLEKLRRRAPETIVNQCRATVLSDCLRAANLPQGFFSLTVPTGGGKTLSSLAFALEHARNYRLKRIIYVIPFTSIIEQNAEVFRSAVGVDAVLEHHSNYEPKEEDHRSRLACENWDAPLIVTTNVQFFESFFGRKSSRCRKLHHIAQSVVILDEAQTIPAAYLKPCMEVLKELVSTYHTSVVLCTATQPAIQQREEFKDGISNVREIIQNTTNLFDSLKRVKVHPPLSKITNQDLSTRLVEQNQVLCIVNTRRQARVMYESIKPSGHAYHLSALMCPVHRSRILKQIREVLKESKTCRVISTQLIEAGVDIDFPVVYRSLAGLDSIAQAAGRCNREGTLDQGEVFVFTPEEPIPAGYFRQTAQEAESVIRRYPEDLLGLDAIEAYFRGYYWSQGDQLDREGILEELKKGKSKDIWFPFQTVSEKFQFIPDVMKPVIVPWDHEAEKLIHTLRYVESYGGLLRKLQPYTVQIHPAIWQKMVAADALEMLHDQFPVLLNMSLYRNDIGLCPEDPDHHDVESLIV